MQSANLTDQARSFIESIHQKVEDGAPAPQQWGQIQNDPVGQTIIIIPSNGTLLVSYQPINNSSNPYVWHWDDTKTPIIVGDNSIPVSAYDWIVWNLPDPTSDGVAISYQVA